MYASNIIILPEWSPESRNPIPWTLPPLHCGGYGIESGLTKSLFIAASAAPPLLPPRGEELEQRGVEWCCDGERFCQSRLYSVPSTVQWGKSSWNRISWFGTSLGYYPVKMAKVTDSMKGGWINWHVNCELRLQPEGRWIHLLLLLFPVVV